jgi:hypothetical protein
MNSFTKDFLDGGVVFCGDVFVLFDCKEQSSKKSIVGDWLPKHEGFEFETTVLEFSDGKCYIPVFTSRKDIPSSLKKGRWIEKRNIADVLKEAKRINTFVLKKVA